MSFISCELSSAKAIEHPIIRRRKLRALVGYTSYCQNNYNLNNTENANCGWTHRTWDSHMVLTVLLNEAVTLENGLSFVYIIKTMLSSVCSCMPVAKLIWRWITSFRSVWATQWDPVSKSNTIKMIKKFQSWILSLNYVCLHKNMCIDNMDLQKFSQVRWC